MTPEMRVQILEGAKSAFFEAMIDGYVGGENRRSVKVKDDDGYTTITYTTEDGKYKVEDRFCTNPFSDEAAGTTTVFFSLTKTVSGFSSAANLVVATKVCSLLQLFIIVTSPTTSEVIALEPVAGKI